MEPSQIKSRLEGLYNNNARIVFWHDEDAEFDELLGDLDLDGVHVIRIGQTPALAIKAEIEINKPDDCFLLYEIGTRPDPQSDWLLDIRLYAETFAADRSSIIRRELGLLQESLRDHVSARSRFFANKERLSRAGRLIEPADDEEAIDRALMAVLLRIEQRDFFSIVRALFATLDPDRLDAAPDAWEDLEKYDLAERFWQLARNSFGYEDDNPSLKNLLMRLMLTDFEHGLKAPTPPALQHLILPKSNAPNSVVCLEQWRDSASFHDSYDALSAVVADMLKLTEHVNGIEIEQFRNVRTFLTVEKFIASRLRDRVMETAETINLEAVRDIVTQRQSSYWANRALTSTKHAPRKALSSVYDALLAAAQFFDLKGQYADGFRYPSPKDFYAAYTADLFKFDQLYRHFCEAADFAEAEGWDILKSLREQVEAAYGNWYLAELALRWGEHLEGGRLIDDWKIEGIPPQQTFYNSHIQPRLDESDDRRVFVVISDAFRYEAAEELTKDLNGRYRFTASLSSQLGVLPSYTALGMASLLPHKQLTYLGNGSVSVDGLPTSGTANRQKILARFDGTAIKAEEFMAMSKPDGRDFIKPHRLIYIYHNQIDQTADTGNEDKTFNAVRTTIDEVANIVARIINSLNGNYILVTADHGFLFQESPPTVTEKNPIADKPSGAVVSKKRYLLGTGLPEHSGAYHGRTFTTAGADGNMEFWVPKGVNRFHFVGGSRFIHGGAMPQEVIVPVIRIAQLKGTSAVKTKTRNVGVTILGGSPIRITTSRHRFRFIQNEAVTERIKPLQVSVALYDQNEPISNVEVINFDSQSTDMNDLKRETWLTLANRTFNKKTTYQLILRNTDTGVEEARMDVTIDLAFDNDF
jgi:uncharacterized protein (TIGR02687 family)